MTLVETTAALNDVDLRQVGLQLLLRGVNLRLELGLEGREILTLNGIQLCLSSERFAVAVSTAALAASRSALLPPRRMVSTLAWADVRLFLAVSTADWAAARSEADDPRLTWSSFAWALLRFDVAASTAACDAASCPCVATPLVLLHPLRSRPSGWISGLRPAWQPPP